MDPFGDPRLAALYDEDNPGGPDHDYYRDLADRVSARQIVDLGCGTGLLTVSLARPGRDVAGVDPSRTMLAIARDRPGAAAVTWLDGDHNALAGRHADLVLMTGNVAQHITGDAWPATLAAVSAALNPGGTLAFESRNPAARGWEEWTPERTRNIRRTPSGPLEEWLEVTRVEGGEVTFTSHNVFVETGERVPAVTTLAFRSAGQLTADLLRAGFESPAIDGGWHGEAVTAESRLLVVRAGKAGPPSVDPPHPQG